METGFEKAFAAAVPNAADFFETFELSHGATAAGAPAKFRQYIFSLRNSDTGVRRFLDRLQSGRGGGGASLGTVDRPRNASGGGGVPAAAGPEEKENCDPPGGGSSAGENAAAPRWEPPGQDVRNLVISHFSGLEGLREAPDERTLRVGPWRSVEGSPPAVVPSPPAARIIPATVGADVDAATEEAFSEALLAAAVRAVGQGGLVRPEETVLNPETAVNTAGLFVGRLNSDDTSGPLVAAGAILEPLRPADDDEEPAGASRGRGGPLDALVPASRPIPLILSRLPSYALFAGQIVAVEGTLAKTAAGVSLFATNVRTGAGSASTAANLRETSPAPPMPAAAAAEVSLTVICGPYCAPDETFNGGRLDAYIDYLEREPARVPRQLLLLGPFVPVDHPLVNGCDPTLRLSGSAEAELLSFEALFCLAVGRLLAHPAFEQSKILIQPAVSDVLAAPVLPQAPLDIVACFRAMADGAACARRAIVATTNPATLAFGGGEHAGGAQPDPTEKDGAPQNLIPISSENLTLLVTSIDPLESVLHNTITCGAKNTPEVALQNLLGSGSLLPTAPPAVPVEPAAFIAPGCSWDPAAVPHVLICRREQKSAGDPPIVVKCALGTAVACPPLVGGGVTEIYLKHSGRNAVDVQVSFLPFLEVKHTSES